MPKVFTVASFQVSPGEKKRGSMPVLNLADGSDVSLPLLVLNGAKDGPAIYLGAAIHGDEVNGIVILARALSQVDPAKLSGRIICVPVQHPLALQSDHRLPVSQFLKSPLDQVPHDAWTCFPGDGQGNIAQIFAASIFSLIRQCDYALDIHTPTRGGRYVPIAILPHPNLGATAVRAEQMAHDMGGGWIMKGDKGMYVSDGILCVEACKAGVPCFTFEIGEGGRLEEESVATGARCVLNILKSLKMIDGTPEPAKKTYLMRDFLGIRAEKGGLLVPVAPLGQEVSSGDVLCRILNVYGDEVQLIKAPQDGVFVRTTTLGSVSQGERVATLGLL
jgi:predicted deacylase